MCERGIDGAFVTLLSLFMPLRFEHRFWSADPRFGRRAEPTPVAAPRLLAVNEALAERLGLTAEERGADDFIAAMAGNGVVAGARPLALAYAGHQFGSFVPQLGDGRALLLGEVVDTRGAHLDLQLKGSGTTPFSRGGDGRAAIGPVLRELIISEAMAALGIPTTEVLMAVGTGELVYRDEAQPGAVLARVAASHLRVGTFEYAAARDDVEGLALLVEHAIARHFPAAADSENTALGLVDAVIDAQATLVASWLGVGFVHGVMNTDNCSIAGETLDYGPCAFVDGFLPTRTFSSIDRGGRYAWGRQPAMAQWNIARLAEALTPLVATDGEDAARVQDTLHFFVDRFEGAYGLAHRAVFARKLGLTVARAEDDTLIASLLSAMAGVRADFTGTFRALISVAADPTVAPEAVLPDPSPALVDWCRGYRHRLDRDPSSSASRVALMRRSNPAVIPRNHVVEAALAAAAHGDLAPVETLRAALRRPFDEPPAGSLLLAPPGADQWRYQTFCGT